MGMNEVEVPVRWDGVDCNYHRWDEWIDWV